MIFETLHEDEYCNVRGNPDQIAQSSRILLSFTGIGQASGGIEVQNLEFVSTASNAGAPIFISDTTRSWGNRLDFELLQNVIAPYIEGRRLFSLGNSMGGFLCVLASSFFPIEAAISFGGQYSVHPRIVPDETRWRPHRNRIDNWRYESLSEHINSTTRYYLFYGDHHLEELHYSRYPRQPNVHCYIFPGRKHNLAGVMKRHGVLDYVVSACLEDRFELGGINAKITEGAYELS